MDLQYSVVGKYSTAGHKDKYKTILSRTPLSDQGEVLMSDTLHTATRALTTIKGKKIAIYSVHRSEERRVGKESTLRRAMCAYKSSIASSITCRSSMF